MIPEQLSILTLDLGTTTGFTLCHKSRLVSGSICFKHLDQEAPGLRFLRFRHEFLTKFRNVREVWFEEVCRHKGTHAAHIYGGFLAFLLAWGEENSIPCRPVGVGTIKKHATRHGRANKEMMIHSMMQRGFKPKDDNEADSLALMDYVLTKLKLPESKKIYQTDKGTISL